MKSRGETRNSFLKCLKAAYEQTSRQARALLDNRRIRRIRRNERKNENGEKKNKAS